MSKKKSDQLEMNFSTASQRLVKDVMFDLICKSDRNKCHHCGLEMSRETFSIEHIKPWLNSENPKELFFSLDNISFSHLDCNIKAGRKPRKKYLTDEERIEAERELVRESGEKIMPRSIVKQDEISTRD